MDYSKLSNKDLIWLNHKKVLSLRGIIDNYINDDKAEKPDIEDLKKEINNIGFELKKRVRLEGLTSIEFDNKYKWVD